MVGRRGEAPLVPPYRFRSPNKALVLRDEQSGRGRPDDRFCDGN